MEGEAALQYSHASNQKALISPFLKPLNKLRCKHNWTLTKSDWYKCILCGCLKKTIYREVPFEVLETQDISVIDETEDKIYIEQRLNELTPRQRDVAFLILEGYKEQDISKKLKISQKQVSVHYQSALKRLKLSRV